MDAHDKIRRPRQLYAGPTGRDHVGMEKCG